jgi:hypothetical protein
VGIGAWVRSLFKEAVSVCEPQEADAEVARLARSLSAGDLRQFAAQLPLLRQARWADRCYFLDALAKLFSADLIDAWSRAEPENALPHLAAGAMLLEQASGARQQALSGELDDPEAGWARVTAFCSRAEHHLEEAHALDLEDPTPAVFLLRARQTLEDRAGAEHHFRQAIERDRWNLPAHASILALLSRRWMGSHDEALGFARGVARVAPEGSVLPMLLISAHLEAWMYTWNFQEDHQRASQRVADPRVIEEAAAAWERSLGSPLFRPDRTTPARRSEAAFWFYLVGDSDRLRRELDLLGNLCTVLPWSWDVEHGDPAKSFRAARRQVGLA